MNIELFSCSGGMAEGFRRAGVEFDFVVDWSADACESYARNLGYRPVQMDVRDLHRMACLGFRPSATCKACQGRGWHVGECHPRETCAICDGRGRIDTPIDLFVADPPCTPWSRAGKRLGLSDERDCLAITVDLIRLWRPLTYLIGNVLGLQDAPSWGVVQEQIGGLVGEGYCVRDYLCLDAAAYGVPQHRVRPFWFGHLSGPCIAAPPPTHGPATTMAPLPGVAPLLPFVTCRDALSHLSPKELGRKTRLRWHAKRKKDHRPSSADEPAKTLTTNTNSNGALLLNLKHPINVADRPSYTVTARDQGDAQGAGALAWPWDRPATTILGDERLSDAGHHDHRKPNSQYASAIVLSEKAAAILQGFPDWWVFSGATKKARWAQIGMAMPPPLAEAVARSIVAAHPHVARRRAFPVAPVGAPPPAPAPETRRAPPAQHVLPLP